MTAAANCTFCCMPFKLAGERLGARREFQPREPGRGSALRFRDAQSTNRGEKGQLLLELHLRVETALFGEIAGPATHGERIAPSEDRPTRRRAGEMPSDVRIVVVFPEPFGPRSPKIGRTRRSGRARPGRASCRTS